MTRAASTIRSWCVAAAATWLTMAAAVGSVHAQDEQFSPEHLKKAWTVIELTKSAEGFDEILPDVAQRTQGFLIQNSPALTREIETTVTETAIDLAKQRVELNRTLQEIWARRFSEEELDVLIAFFESPTGQKFSDLSPSIAALSVGAAEQWRQRLGEEMLAEVRERMRAQGHNL